MEYRNEIIQLFERLTCLVNGSARIFLCAHHPHDPGSPLNGPTTSLVIQPP